MHIHYLKQSKKAAQFGHRYEKLLCNIIFIIDDCEQSFLNKELNVSHEITRKTNTLNIAPNCQETLHTQRQKNEYHLWSLPLSEET